MGRRFLGPPAYIGPAPPPAAPSPTSKSKRSRAIRIPDERDSVARRKAKRRAQTGDWGQDDVEVPMKTVAAKTVPGIPQLRRIVGQLTILSVDRTSRLVLSTIGQTKVSIVRAVGGESEMLRLGDLRGGWGYGQPVDAIWGLALGEYAAGKPNILVDATNGLRIRNFDADLIKLDLAGNADLSGKLLMRGATSAIAIGTTPPTSATAGTGIWIDRTGLYGLNVNVQQTYINNTGQIIAGAGAVSLDAGGIAVSLAAAPADERSYKFTFGGSVVSILQGYVDATLNALNLTLNSVAGKDSILSIAAAGGFGKQSRIILDCGVRLSLFGDLGRTVLMNNLRIQSGNLDWTTDNVNDIGAAGANRPRDLYLGGKITLAGQIVSSLATGTAPLSVASTTKVTNLNADLLDGLDSTAFVGSAHVSCRAYHSVAQSIVSGVVIKLAFDSERWDTDTIHDTVTNNSRLTCKTAGKYSIHANVVWAVNNSGSRLISFLLNGATTIAQVRDDAPASGDFQQSLSTIYDLAVNDYVELSVYQNSGGALNVSVFGNFSPEFMMALLK